MRNVPKLRFKEFTDDLKEIKFKNFLKERKDIATDNEELYSLTIEKGVTPKEERYEREFLVNNEKEAYKIVLKNDFVYNPMNIRFGAVAQFTESKNVKVSKYYNIFYCNNCINSYFFEKFIKTKRMFDLYNKLATGSLNEKKRLHFTDFLEIKQPFPSLEEQEKIADFLSNIDKKISITEGKLNLFNEYKKGIMQKIFNQELRFKDENGNDYPEWEEFTLGQIGDTYNGLTGKSADDFGKGKKYITYKNIFDNTKIDTSILEFVEVKENEKQNKVEYGDIFFTVSSETPDEVGYTSVLLDKINEDIYLNSFCFGYRLKSKEDFYPEFFRYVLRSFSFREKIYILAQGSTRFNLSKTEVLKIKLNLPCFEEQQKIADFLSAVDTKIEKISDELENLKEFKKGLLQQVFV